MNIGFLEAVHLSEDMQKVAGGDFYHRFAKLLPGLSLEPYPVCKGVFPVSVGECDAYIVTGSYYSVYDDEPWINQLRGFVQEVYGDGRKLVGICFGHQMIAEALGGNVIKWPQGWGLGVHRVDISATKPWMVPSLDYYNLNYVHQDQVKTLPPDSTLLGSSQHCPNAIFSVSDQFLGMQAHPEIQRPLLEAILPEIHSAPPDVIQAAIESQSMTTHEQIIASWIERFFAG